MAMKTKNIMDRTAATQIAQTIAVALADTYILYVKTQNFHWNVVDPRFHSLHEMFEDNYKELAEGVDELAERIRMLKIRSPGSMREFLDIGTLEEAEGESTGDDMLHDLCRDREKIATYLRARIKDVIDLGDEGTGDLFIQHLRMHEKAAWMLRSHLINSEL